MKSSDIMSTRSSRHRFCGVFLFSLLFFVAIVPILFLFPQNVYAVDITFAWDANSEEDLAGYRIYYRLQDQSYDYDNPVKELWLTVEEGEEKELLENPNDPSCTIHGLDDNTTYYFMATAFDEVGNESIDYNELCYQPSVNVPPVLNPIGPKTVNEGQLLEFTITASDPDGDALTYSASNLPPGAGFNPATQTFTWTPGYGDTGNYDVLFTVTDDGTPVQSDAETVTITVGDTNRPPVLDTIGPKTVDEGRLLEFTITASDPDGDALTYSASNLPTGAGFNEATQTFNWTPGYGDTGNYDVLFTVTDDGTPVQSDSETVTITVGDTNRPPVLDTIGPKTVDEGRLLEFAITASDPDGDALTYSASNLPTGAGFNEATQTFNWTPGYGDTGNYDVLFTVTDDGTPVQSDSETVTITVGDTNRPPVLDTIGPKTVDEGRLLEFAITASDPDGDALTYSGSNLPPGAGFNPATQTFNWTPGYGDTGNYDVLFTVTDDGTPVQSDAETVTITVGDTNRPPVLDTIGPKTVDEGRLLEFTITASDPDGDALTYSASNLPTGAGFNPATQTFNWTPGYGDTGNYDVLFTVTDDGAPAQSDAETVTITVVPVSNLAPLEPIITSPYYGQTECELLTNITTEPFSDPDGDSHSQSRWHISKKEDFSSLMLDVNSTEHLTKLPVPHAVLETGSTYYVRVQFYDAYSETSGWSDSVEFTTTTSDFNDVDANGIPDDQEVGDDVDLNGDGIADNDQPEVIKCIHSSVDNVTICLCKISDSINAIEALETIDPSTISEKIMRPQKFLLGLFSYRLSVNEPGAKATVRVYFSESISKAREFYKYDTISGWQDWTEHTIFNDDGRSVTLEVVDGGFGDSDAVANGVIVDPGALVEETEVVATDENIRSGGDDGSSSGGGCFIATATFGSYAEPQVKLLRDFRDQYLLTNMPGRWFVRMYYRYSPYWADLINIHTGSKPIVRLSLMPLVGISYVLIKASLVTKILYGLLPALCVLGCFVRMHGRPVKGG